MNNISLKRIKKISDIKNWDYDVKECEAGGTLEQVADDISYVLRIKPAIYNEDIREYLLEEAIYRGTYRFQSWDEERYHKWKDFYTNLPVEFKTYSEKPSFERYASIKADGNINPIEYVLFIRSLYGSMEKFIRSYLKDRE